MREILKNLLCLLCYSPLLLKGQRTLNATGNTLVAGGSTYAYSVGEASGFSLTDHCAYTPGVIQPMKISLKPPDQKLFDNYHLALLYPNPARDFIIIESNDAEISNYQIASYDGKIMQTGKYTYMPVSIKGLQTGIYLLTLFSNDFKRKQTFKIIKL